MNIKEVKDLIHEVLQSDINEFELEHTGTKIRLKRGFSADPAPSLPVISAPASAPAVAAIFPQQGAPPAPAEEVEKKQTEEEEGDLHIITSPIVGTFYRGPSPDTEPYAKVGDTVEVGTILCILEAMKLMNEIPSDCAGEIVRIYVENGRPVEYAQKLFAIRPRK